MGTTAWAVGSLHRIYPGVYAVGHRAIGRHGQMLAAVLAEAGLPRPRCNATLRIGGHRLEVDFLWEEQRLVVETDGARTHRTGAGFGRDRWRDQVLMAAGYRTTRVTWRQLEDEPAATLGRLRRMLGA